MKYKLIGNAMTMVIITACVVSGCTTSPMLTFFSELDAQTSIGQSLEKAMRNTDITVNTEINGDFRERSVLEQINTGKADIGIVKNFTKIDNAYPNIRTIMPLFPEVFLALYKPNIHEQDFMAVCQTGKKTIAFRTEEEKVLISKFIDKLDIANFDTVRWDGTSGFPQKILDADVLFMFSSLNNSLIGDLLESKGFAIHDFNGTRLAYGSLVDGFCLQFPQAVAFTIPVAVFGSSPSKPVQTFAIYDVLVGHKNIESELVYDAIESIYNSKAILAQDNFEFALLNEDFDSHAFLFPLHEGTIAYLNRNQPSFWERYAELIGLGSSLVAIAAGAISTNYRRLKQRRKDNIEEYYSRLLEINDQLYTGYLAHAQVEGMLKESLQIRSLVFNQSKNESFRANLHFFSFVALIQSTIDALERRLSNSCIPNENRSV